MIDVEDDDVLVYVGEVREAMSLHTSYSSFLAQTQKVLSRLARTPSQGFPRVKIIFHEKDHRHKKAKVADRDVLKIADPVRNDHDFSIKPRALLAFASCDSYLMKPNY